VHDGENGVAAGDCKNAGGRQEVVLDIDEEESRHREVGGRVELCKRRVCELRVVVSAC
jgi:hypothetical protein